MSNKADLIEQAWDAVERDKDDDMVRGTDVLITLLKSSGVDEKLAYHIVNAAQEIGMNRVKAEAKKKLENALFWINQTHR